MAELKPCPFCGSTKLKMESKGKNVGWTGIDLNNGEAESQVCTGWLNGEKWHLILGDMDYYTEWGRGAVTHWMPLPEPPKGE